MSIVAAIKVYDGIVLGADSASTIQAVQNNEVAVIKTYHHAKKLFTISSGDNPQVGGGHIGVLTYGLGNIGEQSMESIVYDFNHQIVPKVIAGPVSVENVANAFLTFLKGLYDAAFAQIIPEQKPQLGFYFAGYANGDTLPSEWEFVLPADSKSRRVREEKHFGASWRGMNDPFLRLHKGFDNYFLNELIQTFGLDANQVKAMQAKYENQVAYNGMPLQDAVDFVRYILSTTILYYKFGLGAPVCSDPIDIIAITRNGIEHVKMKELR